MIVPLNENNIELLLNLYSTLEANDLMREEETKIYFKFAIIF